MKHRFFPIGACAAVFCISGTGWGGPAPIFAQGRLAKPAESSTTSALKALASPSGSPIVEIRTLGRSREPTASARLLELFEDNRSHPDALIELELVRALASHTSGTERDAVVRALLALFELKGAVFAESPETGSPSDQSLELRSGALFHFARGSAALALAQAQHPEAARVLVLTATQTTQEDIVGARFARDALSAFPLSAEARKLLGPLVDPRSLKRLDEQAPEPQLPVKSPLELARLGESPANLADSLTKGHSETPQTLSTWRDVIEALDTQKSWPEAFLEPSAWEKAAQLKSPWTMRALALLVPGRPFLQKVAQRSATKALGSRDLNERFAAAFLLAVLSPEQAANQLTNTDEVIRRAVLSQASTGPLAKAAFARANEGGMPTEAFRISLHEPSTWDHWSTRALWTLGASARFKEWTSPLAARMAPRPGEGAPAVSQVAAWLNDASPQLRAAAIFGLARSDAPSARGLLLATYRTETDVAVRRGVCHAFWRQQMQEDATVKSLIRLDPDAGCRALAHGKSDPGARRFRVLRTTATKVEIIDRVGSTHVVFAAPDGFVGLVGADL